MLDGENWNAAAFNLFGFSPRWLIRIALFVAGYLACLYVRYAT